MVLYKEKKMFCASAICVCVCACPVYKKRKRRKEQTLFISVEKIYQSTNPVLFPSLHFPPLVYDVTVVYIV